MAHFPTRGRILNYISISNRVHPNERTGRSSDWQQARYTSECGTSLAAFGYERQASSTSPCMHKLISHALIPLAEEGPDVNNRVITGTDGFA